jgi:hypothetical protein
LLFFPIFELLRPRIELAALAAPPLLEFAAVSLRRRLRLVAEFLRMVEDLCAVYFSLLLVMVSSCDVADVSQGVVAARSRR